MAKTLSKSKYQTLLKQITTAYLDAQTESKKSVNQIITRAYWQIGQYIVEIEQQQKLRADYGDELIKRLSEDLSEQIGTGFSPTNIKYMRRFYLTYKKGHARAQLPWTHYRSLLSIKDPELRTYYENQASEHDWSSRDLDRYLKIDNVEREKLKAPVPATITQPRTVTKPEYPIQRGRLYHYALKNSPIGEMIQSPLMVDCGFRIFREMTYKKVGPLKSGDLASCKKMPGDYQLRRSDISPDDIYTYRAVVDRVVDGDTLLCWVDVGFANYTQQRFRLRNINAPEIKTERGQKARAFVQESLQHCPFIVVKTYKTDKYDRYLADVFYLNGVKYADVVAEEGRLLNQDLVENNLATLVK